MISYILSSWWHEQCDGDVLTCLRHDVMTMFSWMTSSRHFKFKHLQRPDEPHFAQNCGSLYIYTPPLCLHHSLYLLWTSPLFIFPSPLCPRPCRSSWRAAGGWSGRWSVGGAGLRRQCRRGLRWSPWWVTATVEGAWPGGRAHQRRQGWGWMGAGGSGRSFRSSRYTTCWWGCWWTGCWRSRAASFSVSVRTSSSSSASTYPPPPSSCSSACCTRQAPPPPAPNQPPSPPCANGYVLTDMC